MLRRRRLYAGARRATPARRRARPVRRRPTWPRRRGSPASRACRARRTPRGHALELLGGRGLRLVGRGADALDVVHEVLDALLAERALAAEHTPRGHGRARSAVGDDLGELLAVVLQRRRSCEVGRGPGHLLGQAVGLLLGELGVDDLVGVAARVLALHHERGACRRRRRRRGSSRRAATWCCRTPSTPSWRTAPRRARSERSLNPSLASASRNGSQMK